MNRWMATQELYSFNEFVNRVVNERDRAIRGHYLGNIGIIGSITNGNMNGEYFFEPQLVRLEHDAPIEVLAKTREVKRILGNKLKKRQEYCDQLLIEFGKTLMRARRKDHLLTFLSDGHVMVLG
jgi:hypothetical protein